MADPMGTPIWFELSTAEPDAAQNFLERVVGWRFATSPLPEHGGYRMGGPGEHDAVAGLMDGGSTAGGLPGWSIYLAADDVDAAAARVNELGGTVHFGPADIPQVGRFAVVADPQGVIFTLMRGDSPEDSRAFVQAADGSVEGRGVWIELATPDPDGAFAFYGALFGWTKAGAMPMGPMGDYAFIGAAGPTPDCPDAQATGPGAIMSSSLTNAPARWNWYVHVPDIDVAVAAAKDAGGTLFQEPMQIPGGEYSANIADAQGHQLGLVGPRKGAAL
ncbi:VOC family protein [Sphingomonas sp. RS2018]